MKAQVIEQFGPPSVFELKDIEKPKPKNGHVLIKVMATSVNQIDCKIRAGVVPEIAPKFPAILHADVAGVVAECANDVTTFKVGDEVFGCAGGLLGTPGSLSEFMLADINLIGKKPNHLSMTEAAALPLVSITAWEALFDKANLQKSQSILIHGGVGGVGHIALQLARWKGAKVFTTVLKNEDIPLAKKLGADEVINAKEETVSDYIHRLTNNEGFDVVFDTVGGLNLNNSFVAVKTNGHVVTTAARATIDLTPMHNKALSLHVVFMLLPILKNQGRQKHAEILSQIKKIVDDGALKPLIDDQQFSFEEVSKAHERLESGKATGKIVIQYDE